MTFDWAGAAREELRSIDRETAMRILLALTRLGESGEGDVRQLTGEWKGFARPRVGDHRVIFQATPSQIMVIRVRHRSEVYR